MQSTPPSDTDFNLWPKELNVSPDRKSLTVVFDNGESLMITAEMMRVLSPSAEVQGHSAEQRVTVAGKINVKIENMVPVGNYAARVKFDDGHDTGIFTWRYLYKLGTEKDVLWAEHLKELEEKGLTREFMF